MQGAALSAKKLNSKSSFNECKSRLKDMFNNQNSKHIFSFSSFMKKALSLLDEYKYDDLFFNELSNRTIREQNKYGSSQLSTYIKASQNQQNDKEELQADAINNTVPCNYADDSPQLIAAANDIDSTTENTNEDHSNLDECGSLGIPFNQTGREFDICDTENRLIGA